MREDAGQVWVTIPSLNRALVLAKSRTKPVLTANVHLFTSLDGMQTELPMDQFARIFLTLLPRHVIVSSKQCDSVFSIGRLCRIYNQRQNMAITSVFMSKIGHHRPYSNMTQSQQKAGRVD